MNETALELIKSTVPAFVNGENLTAIDWGAYDEGVIEEFGRLVELNRYGGHLRAYSRKSGNELPALLSEMVETYQRKTIYLNAMYLKTLRYMMPKFEVAGVRVSVFKGVAAQNEVYSDYFVKHTTDVDFYVQGSDFALARKILTEAGFGLAPGCDSIWWSFFLGEQHFNYPEGAFMAADLHHRVDQPGCPQPRRKAYFLEAAVLRNFGAGEVLTLGAIQNALFNALSLAKAYLHREPCGKYLADLQASFVSFDELERARLVAFAREQGLLQTLAFAAEAVHAVFGTQFLDDKLPRSRALALTPPDHLLDSLLDPDANGILWPRRLRTLRALSDVPTQFIISIVRKMASEGWHWLFESRRDAAKEAPGPIFS